MLARGFGLPVLVLGRRFVLPVLVLVLDRRLFGHAGVVQVLALDRRFHFAGHAAVTSWHGRGDIMSCQG